MNDVTIALEPNPTDAHRNAIAEGLAAFNVGHAVDRRRRDMVFLARAASAGAGAVVGGVEATIKWNWIEINRVWVAESRRGSGVGTRLMNAVEAAAVAEGCDRALLDTLSFQARPFYERLGYEVFGALDDFPPGHRRFFMCKRLRPNDEPPKAAAGPFVRRATAADLKAIEAFDQFRHVTAAVIANGQCDVVDDRGAVAAYMVRTNLLFGRPFVSYIVVHGEHRRRGHASRLLAHAEAECPADKLWISTGLENKVMQQLLAGRGYKMAGVLDEMFRTPELIYFKRVR